MLNKYYYYTISAVSCNKIIGHNWSSNSRLFKAEYRYIIFAEICHFARRALPPEKARFATCKWQISKSDIYIYIYIQLRNPNIYNKQFLNMLEEWLRYSENKNIILAQNYVFQVAYILIKLLIPHGVNKT